MGGQYYPQVAIILSVRWENFRDDGSPDSNKTWDIPILAKRVKVNINDYRSADTFSAEIEYKNFPFDPRNIRACGISIFMEDMKRLVGDDGRTIQIVPRKKGSDTNAIFVGFVDEDSIRLDEDTRMVTLEGRDFTSLLIDTPFAKGTVDLAQPVDVVIKSLLAELPATEKIELVNRVDGPLPTIAAFGETKDATTGRKNVKRGESYWDVIQDIVSRAGLIAYIELDTLVLSKPRVLYSKDRIRPFIYGRNLSNLELKRKLGRRKNFNIVVRSLVLGEKRVAEVKIPLQAKPEWGAALSIPLKEVKLPEIAPDGSPVPDDQAKAAPYMAFLVPDVTSDDQLVQIGQGIYEEIGRQQLEGSFETKDMDLCLVGKDGRSQEHFSVLKIRNGTPVSIEIENQDIDALKRIASPDKRRQYLIQRCYSAPLADIIAHTMGKFANVFYTKAAEFTMDSDQGFGLKVEFLNFIETSNKAFTGKR